MPKSNNTRRNSNKRNSGRNRSTRRSVNLMGTNELFQQMMRGEVQWGDILANEPAARRASPKKPSPVYDIAYNALENYTVPDLTLRKGIWENFPVVVNEIDDGDGTQRYEIKWDRKKMELWRSEAPYNIAMEYEAMMEYRLIHSLRQFPHKYRLERPRSKNQIVIIAMVHADGPRRAAAAPAAPAMPAVPAAPAVPRLVRLNDIKEHFPVVWHEIPGRAGTKTYEIELFGKKVREMSMAAGRDLSGDIRAQLLRALEASPSWIVLPAAGAGAGPIRIEMRVRQ